MSPHLSPRSRPDERADITQRKNVAPTCGVRRASARTRAILAGAPCARGRPARARRRATPVTWAMTSAHAARTATSRRVRIHKQGLTECLTPGATSAAIAALQEMRPARVRSNATLVCDGIVALGRAAIQHVPTLVESHPRGFRRNITSHPRVR